MRDKVDNYDLRYAVAIVIRCVLSSAFLRWVSRFHDP